jgi:MGT family glycosyltransferase
MPTFVLSAPPLLGHFLPVAAVARALVARGQRVVFHAPANRRATVVALGAEHIPQTIEAQVGTHVRRAMERHVRLPTIARGLVVHRDFVAASTTALARELAGLATSAGAAAIVADSQSVGAGYAAELSGVPFVSIGTFPGAAIDGAGRQTFPTYMPRVQRWTPMSVFTRVVDAAYDFTRVRRALRLAPRKTGAPELFNLMFSRELNIVSASPWFYGTRHLRARQALVGPLSWTLADAVDANHYADGSVVVTLSTVRAPPDPDPRSIHARSARYARNVIDACRGLASPVVAATGGRYIAELPPNVTAFAQVDYRRLLPKARVVVTHGGWGVVSWALRYGVPMVIVPVMADQLANATRLCELGLARHVPLEAATPAVLRQEIEGALDLRTLRARLAKHAEEHRAIDPGASAADAIVALAEGAAPAS